MGSDGAGATLYRAFDAEDQLLYVGISVGPRERFNQHAATKPWWNEVARIEIERFATAAEAGAAELTAIRDEHPRYNVSPRNSADLDAIREVIADYGSKRQEGLDLAQEYLAKVAGIAPDAIDAGMTKVEIAKLAGITRRTLDRLLGVYDS